MKNNQKMVDLISQLNQIKNKKEATKIFVTEMSKSFKEKAEKRRAEKKPKA